ncbi:hypothetical protein [Xenorhabdus bovienii]|uniref:hypothetical protein n=1 Tax=Xenorhabdus bovienii TaxID=40576 RepID=UPI0023B2A073|nr:hypothetical protein [Xenorhabdus bovienii]
MSLKQIPKSQIKPTLFAKSFVQITLQDSVNELPAFTIHLAIVQHGQSHTLSDITLQKVG